MAVSSTSPDLFGQINTDDLWNAVYKSALNPKVPGMAPQVSVPSDLLAHLLMQSNQGSKEIGKQAGLQFNMGKTTGKQTTKTDQASKASGQDNDLANQFKEMGENLKQAFGFISSLVGMGGSSGTGVEAD